MIDIGLILDTRNKLAKGERSFGRRSVKTFGDGCVLLKMAGEPLR